MNQAISWIQHDLMALESWNENWLIKFSPFKFQFLAFKCTIFTDSNLVYGVSVPVQTSVRPLGVRYSCTLGFLEQVEYQLVKGRQMMRLISCAFSLPQARLELCTMYIRHVLEYGSIFGSSLREVNRVGLDSFQRSISKAVTGFSTTITYHITQHPTIPRATMDEAI
jgi:hypothetical protein